MKDILVSIIVPVYNSKNSLVKCLDSILAQTFEGWQLILVDDGSEDGSSVLCDYYVSLYPLKIKVFHKKNGGVSSARNVGIDVAEGDYVCFVDSDDYLDNDYLASFVTEIKSDDVLYVQGHKVVKNELIIENYIKGNNVIKELTGIGDLGHLWDKIFCRKVIKYNNLRFVADFTFCEDEAFVLDYIAVSSGSIKYIPKACYNYVAATTQKKYFRDNNVGVYFYCLHDMIKICKQNRWNIYDVYSKMLARCSRQFFKGSTYSVLSFSELMDYMNTYKSVNSIPLFSSWTHFIIMVLDYCGMIEFFFKSMIYIFRCRCV